MLTETYRPEEKSKAQGANDFLLFGSVAFASLMAGQTLNAWGWNVLNLAVFPVVVICLGSLLLLAQIEGKSLHKASQFVQYLNISLTCDTL